MCGLVTFVQKWIDLQFNVEIYYELNEDDNGFTRMTVAGGKHNENMSACEDYHLAPFFLSLYL